MGYNICTLKMAFSGCAPEKGQDHKVSENKKKNEKGAKRRRSGRRAYSGKKVALWLVLCFPAGLFYLWSERCEWPRICKALISLLITALLVVILMPQTQPPERYIGGVRLLTAEDMLIGPQPTEGFERIDLYAYNMTTESVLAEPEPTPVPIYVYCNNGGDYYHTKECTYYKPTSVRVPLLQALDAGYQQCKECDAPEAY